MELQGYVYANDGMTISIKAMHTQMSMLNVHTDNIASYGVPGYQKKSPVITSFAEILGPNSLDEATSTEIGRLRRSGNPLDIALNTPGYFQKLNAYGGVDLTRDGRFHVDKDGYLKALDGKRILSAAGLPVRFPMIPDDLEKKVKINPNGEVQLYDTRNGNLISVATIGVANEQGAAAGEVDMKQGYVEDSNVMLQDEYMAIMPLRREFEANRQMFIVQNDNLSRMIQELGRTQ
ncbi:flagellar basal body rod C-terminal domain-containing protein [Vampirovibrio sp.]|uniref:flagellar basal body rod C-terminal domain-containing protein n=1 Tax=Vampirovibrio sp. TaxID=2717857 RepID=UPI003593B258